MLNENLINSSYEILRISLSHHLPPGLETCIILYESYVLYIIEYHIRREIKLFFQIEPHYASNGMFTKDAENL